MIFVRRYAVAPALTHPCRVVCRPNRMRVCACVCERLCLYGEKCSPIHATLRLPVSSDIDIHMCVIHASVGRPSRTDLDAAAKKNTSKVESSILSDLFIFKKIYCLKKANFLEKMGFCWQFITIICLEKYQKRRVEDIWAWHRWIQYYWPYDLLHSVVCILCVCIWNPVLFLWYDAIFRTRILPTTMATAKHHCGEYFSKNFNRKRLIAHRRLCTTYGSFDI